MSITIIKMKDFPEISKNSPLFGELQVIEAPSGRLTLAAVGALNVPNIGANFVVDVVWATDTKRHGKVMS